MKIAGIQMNSMVDYPGCMAAVIFTAGCNMNCSYCHNRAIIDPRISPSYDPAAVLADLKKRAFLLDGVVISGGEPTLQLDLKDFILRVRQLGYKIKLDTNGTNPILLYNLMKEKLLDYVAMDIKAPFEKYRYICGGNVSLKAVQKSIDILMAGDVDYEFRTTIAPQLTEDDILRIAQRIQGAGRYFLQQYRLPREQSGQTAALPHSTETLIRMTDEIKNYIPACGLRGA